MGSPSCSPSWLQDSLSLIIYRLSCSVSDSDDESWVDDLVSLDKDNNIADDPDSDNGNNEANARDLDRKIAKQIEASTSPLLCSVKNRNKISMKPI